MTRSTTLSLVAAFLALSSTAELCADRAPRRRVDDRQRRAVHRLPLPRHLADQQESGVPGWLRLLRTSRASTSAIGTPTSTPAMYNGGNLEMDFYGGFKGSFDAFSYDVGRALLLLPGLQSAAWRAGHLKVDNTELYVSRRLGPVLAEVLLRDERLLRRHRLQGSVLRRRDGDLSVHQGVLADRPRRLSGRPEERCPHHRDRRQRAA